MEQIMTQDIELEAKRTQVIEKMQKFIHTDRNMKFLVFIFFVIIITNFFACQNSKINNSLASEAVLATWDSLLYANKEYYHERLDSNEKRFISDIKKYELHKRIINYMDSIVVFNKNCGISLHESQSDEDGSYSAIIKLCDNPTIYTFYHRWNEDKIKYESIPPSDWDIYRSMSIYGIVANRYNKTYCDILNNPAGLSPTVECYIIIN